VYWPSDSSVGLIAHPVVIDDDNSDSDSIHSSHNVINRDDVPAVEHASTPATDSDNDPVSSNLSLILMTKVLMLLK
jgi:hypothetical protein